MRLLRQAMLDAQLLHEPRRGAAEQENGQHNEDGRRVDDAFRVLALQEWSGQVRLPKRGREKGGEGKAREVPHRKLNGQGVRNGAP